MKNKLFILGVDGATFDVLTPWIEAGELPGFASILKQGCHGVLKSSLPPLSPVAWTSIASGVNPGKHGVYDFLLQKKTGGRSSYFTFATGADRRCKAFWELLSDAGKRCIIANMPCSYPPDPIQGLMISGWDGAKDPASSFYPAGLQERIQSACGDYYMIPLDLLSKSEMAQDDEASNRRLAGALIQMAKRRSEVFLTLAREENWDTFFGVFTETDTAQHRFWSTVNNPLDDNTVFAIYREVDEFICRLNQEFGEELNLMVVSDHGFGPLQSGVNLNRYLEQAGFLKRRRSILKSLIFSALHHLRPLRGALKGILRTRWMPERLAAMKPRHLGIDFRRSKVFFEGAYAFFYTPPGISDDAIYPTLREALLQLEHEGEKVFYEVLRREDAFHGPHIKELPAFIGVMNDAFEVSGAEVFMAEGERDNSVFTPHLWNGNHNPNGIFMYRGNPDATGRLESLQVYDIAPTVLAFHGLPVPREMDGTVIPAVIGDRTVDIKDIYIYKEPDMVATPMDAEHMAVLKDRLEALGYL